MIKKFKKIWIFLIVLFSVVSLSAIILLLASFGKTTKFSVGAFTSNYTSKKYYYHEETEQTELSVSNFKGTTEIKKKFNSPGVLKADISDGKAFVRIGEEEKKLENNQYLSLENMDELKIQGEFSGKIVYSSKTGS